MRMYPISIKVKLIYYCDPTEKKEEVNQMFLRVS